MSDFKLQKVEDMSFQEGEGQEPTLTAKTKDSTPLTPKSSTGYNPEPFHSNSYTTYFLTIILPFPFWS
jgi:hypothetical protein